MFIPKATTKSPDLNHPLLVGCDFLYWAKDYWAQVPRNVATLTSLPSGTVGPIPSPEGMGYYCDHTASTGTRMAWTVDKGWTAKQSGMVWFKMNTIQNSAFPRLFTWDGRTVNTYFLFYIRHTNSQTVLQHYADPTTSNFVATTFITPGVPQCLAYTVDGTSSNWSVKLYLNGVDVSPATTVTEPIIESTNSRMTIGNSGAGGSQLQGYVYGATHWNRVLSAEEIRKAYLDIPGMFK